jgi:hypothetical protein
MRLCKEVDPATGASPCFHEEGHYGYHAWETRALQGLLRRTQRRSVSALQPTGGWAVALVISSGMLAAFALAILLVFGSPLLEVQ